METRKQLFVEKIGLMFEQSGLPRMAGRIIGWLLICDPPSQSATQLCDELQASKGSISSMTRLLLQLSIIEKVALPGERRDYYQVQPGLWIEALTAKLAIITEFRRLAEEGLTLLEEQSADVRERLTMMYETYNFFETELPILIQRWHDTHKEHADE